MSDRLGPIKYAEDEDAVFLGRELGHRQLHSPATAVAIDEEVRRIVDDCYRAAEQILRERSNEIELIAKALMEHEVVNGEELDTLLRLESWKRKRPSGRSFIVRCLTCSQAAQPDRGTQLNGTSPSPSPQPA